MAKIEFKYKSDHRAWAPRHYKRADRVEVHSLIQCIVTDSVRPYAKDLHYHLTPKNRKSEGEKNNKWLEVEGGAWSEDRHMFINRL